MSWEAIPDHSRRVRDTFGISVTKYGITIWIPRGHPLCAAERVTTAAGQGPDEGWIRVSPSKTTGRRVMCADPKKPAAQRQHLIKYTTLPKAPGLLGMTQLEVASGPNGAVDMRLPWAPAKPQAVRSSIDIGLERRSA